MDLVEMWTVVTFILLPLLASNFLHSVDSLFLLPYAHSFNPYWQHYRDFPPATFERFTPIASNVLPKSECYNVSVFVASIIQ